MVFKSSSHKALVTGGSRGIGAGIVSAFKEAGIEVLAPTRSELDLMSPSSIDRYISQNQGSQIDILVNNAGINVLNSLDHLKSEDWQAMVQTNLTAPLRLIQGFSGPMKNRKWGRIVNISSFFSFITKENRAAYSATKSGLNGLTRTAAVELAPFNVLVNAVCPGYIDTELTRKNNPPADLEIIEKAIPMRRMAKTEEIAQYVLFLCSDMNSYMTGQAIIIDGGFSLK